MCRSAVGCHANWPGGSGSCLIQGEPATKRHECRVVDISMMGLGLMFQHPSPSALVGRRMSVDVSAVGDRVSIRLEGKVTNATVTPGGAVRVGIEFDDSSGTEPDSPAVQSAGSTRTRSWVHRATLASCSFATNEGAPGSACSCGGFSRVETPESVWRLNAVLRTVQAEHSSRSSVSSPSRRPGLRPRCSNAPCSARRRRSATGTSRRTRERSAPDRRGPRTA